VSFAACLYIQFGPHRKVASLNDVNVLGGVRVLAHDLVAVVDTGFDHLWVKDLDGPVLK